MSNASVLFTLPDGSTTYIQSDILHLVVANGTGSTVFWWDAGLLKNFVAQESPVVIEAAASTLVSLPTTNGLWWLNVNRIKEVYSGPQGTVVVYNEGGRFADIIVYDTPANVSSAINAVAGGGGGGAISVTDSITTVNNVSTLEFSNRHFSVQTSGMGAAYVNKVIGIGEVLACRVNFMDSIDTWNPNGKCFPVTQDTIPPGTWELVNVNINNMYMDWNYGGSMGVRLGFENIGAIGEDTSLVYDDIGSGGPSFFVDGGWPYAYLVNLFTGCGWINTMPMTYDPTSTGNPVTSYYQPQSTNTSGGIISNSGQGFGSFYLQGYTAPLNSGYNYMFMTVFLRKVA